MHNNRSEHFLEIAPHEKEKGVKVYTPKSHSLVSLQINVGMIPMMRYRIDPGTVQFCWTVTITDKVRQYIQVYDRMNDATRQHILRTHVLTALQDETAVRFVFTKHGTVITNEIFVPFSVPTENEEMFFNAMRALYPWYFDTQLFDQLDVRKGN